jgi:hypothetical protein
VGSAISGKARVRTRGDNCPVFQPSQHDVRRFLCAAWRKRRDDAQMTPIETLASLWIAEHPEYDTALSDEEIALAADYSVEGGRANPFLHLSMHLTFSVQCSIDQPRGIRAAVEALAARLDSLHEAHHQAMECLGEMVWASQRSGQPPDGEAYLECVKRRAGTTT